jgi:hypothetical protein
LQVELDLSTQLRTTGATIVSGAVAERVEAHLSCFAFFMTSFTYPMVYRHCLYFSWQSFIICMFLGNPSLSAGVTGVRVPQTAIGCL